MPTYSVRDNDTGEMEEVFMTYSALQEYLKANPKSKLKIFGSTDKSGSEEYNLNLGAKRANSSKNYLIQLGVSSKQLETINLGESKSQNSNSKQERAKARSTTYKIIPLLP